MPDAARMGLNGADGERTNNEIGILIWINDEHSVINPAAKHRTVGEHSDDAISILNHMRERRRRFPAMPENNSLIEQAIARGSKDHSQGAN